MRSLLVFIFCLGAAAQLWSQDSLYTRQLLKELCSEKCYGRGYLKGGLSAAEKLIVKEIKKNKAMPLFGKKYTQAFYHSVNTFPAAVDISINGKALQVGVDFIPNADNASLQGSCQLDKKDSASYFGAINGRMVTVKVKQKLTYTVGHKENKAFEIELDKQRVKEVPTNISINFKNKLEANFKSNNMGCKIKGTSSSDSIIVFTAHYDHLGGLGKSCYFPGANDNASGVSMVLNLIKHYAAHPPKYTTVFLFFAGEEAGLVGSEYFVKNSPIDLKRIKFLLNLDLMGSGDEGIMVVNGAVFEAQFKTLTALNDEKQLLPIIKKRGKAANSDHYWFSEQGVPCFFIYTMGGSKAYHDVFDKPEVITLSKYREVFQILNLFVSRL